MRYRLYTVLVILCCIVSSCVREDIPDCPALQVTLTVKDKNYFNVDEIDLEHRADENLAFKDYVPTIYYVLRRVDNDEIVEKIGGVLKLSTDMKQIPISFCPCIPHGKYILTVWGGINDETPLGDDPTTLKLHIGNNEGRDIYMSTDTLVYDAWNNNKTIELERVKGKLLVKVEKLPSVISYSAKKIDNVYGAINSSFEYSEKTYVETQYHWGDEQEILTGTVLSPSLDNSKSNISLEVAKDEQFVNYEELIKSLPIEMKRNELTVLKVIYDGEFGQHKIYLFVDGQWHLTHDMGLE